MISTWTEDVLVDEFVKGFEKFIILELSLNDVGGVGFALLVGLGLGGLLDGLGGLLESKELENIGLIGHQVLAYFREVNNIGLNAIALTLDFELHFGHFISIAGVLNS